MLSVLLLLPVTGGILVLLLPRNRRAPLHTVALLTAIGTLFLSSWLGVRVSGTGNIQQHTSWIPSIGAEYALLLDGISLPLVLLTTFLTTLALVYSTYASEPGKREDIKEYLFMFLLMETGLLGVFLASDLLLFYVFWEVALVPLYFIIGMWGHEKRREAAMKFFLYTRAGSLGLLLSILALYLRTEPHSFSLAAIQAAGRQTSGAFALFALLGFVLGFGVKLPILPLHSWLPDAHVEAPTAGSVMLAGVLLKIGGYGMIRIMLPTLSHAIAATGKWFIVIGLLGVIYGAGVAMAQSDFKRLVAFSSINHMGFVLLGIAVASIAATESDKLTAINGAVLQMVSHGWLTGGMFFLVGMLQERAHTRELSQLGGAWIKMPVYAAVLTVFAFGSFGLPTMSGFIAEFQIFMATLVVNRWAAVLLAFGVAISTALYLRALQNVTFGGVSPVISEALDLNRKDFIVLAPIIIFIFFIGLMPQVWIRGIEAATRTFLTR